MESALLVIPFAYDIQKKIFSYFLHLHLISVDEMYRYDSLIIYYLAFIVLAVMEQAKGEVLVGDLLSDFCDLHSIAL